MIQKPTEPPCGTERAEAWNLGGWLGDHAVERVYPSMVEFAHRGKNPTPIDSRPDVKTVCGATPTGGGRHG